MPRTTVIPAAASLVLGGAAALFLTFGYHSSPEPRLAPVAPVSASAEGTVGDGLSPIFEASAAASVQGKMTEPVAQLPRCTPTPAVQKPQKKRR